MRALFRHEWVVYAKRPFGGPEHVLHYLARYTHRVAISTQRIVDFDDGKVTFRWKNYAQKGKTRSTHLGPVQRPVEQCALPPQPRKWVTTLPSGSSAILSQNVRGH